MGCTLSVKVQPLSSSPFFRSGLSPKKKSFYSPPASPLKRGDPTRRSSMENQPQRAAPATRKGAVFVGIDHYRQWPVLSSAVNDATAMAALFEDLGYDTTVLLNEQATTSKILRSVEACTVAYDTFVVGLYGHGIAPDGVGGMFVPVDAEVSTHAYDKVHSTTLKELSGRSRATSGLFVFDFCYSGAFLGPQKRGADWRVRLAREKARVVVTSGLRNQRVDDGEGHSPFTKALLGNVREQASIVEAFLATRKSLETDIVAKDVGVPKIGRWPGDGGGDIFL